MSGRPLPGEALGLLEVNLCLADIARCMLGAQVDPLSQHVPVFDDVDPEYGLHDFHVSVALRSHRRLLWTLDAQKVFWDEQRSDCNQATFALVDPDSREPPPAPFKGAPKLSWKTSAFSGLVEDVAMIDITIWDERDEMLWLCSTGVAFEAAGHVAEAGVVFDRFDETGEARMVARVNDPHRGVSVKMQLRRAMAGSGLEGAEEESQVVGVELVLTSECLRSWFGQANNIKRTRGM